MIRIDPEEISERENYKLLTGTIIPRPIALVTTLSEDGVLNAAPFSYFNIVTADPPLISVSVQRKKGIPKDTSRHAIARGEFVVHIADEAYVEKLNVTAANLPPEESEVALAGLTAVPSEHISVPGIAEAKVRLECVLEQAIPLGGTAEAPAADLLIGRVVRYHLDEAVVDERRHVDAAALQPVSRLAGSSYAKLGEQFEVERPS
ncbi:NADH-FMN oxidoreductase RutF, flavin reductase (DIM6/NTAB) family [Paenibacillus catalpae]|uniref:NADH-FMN oxidoreductase RutF, flavin reductase (DIM6/NTAB) family n=1 Tax=Paenibacillus catalpae TaxID=1045775 RepID=A0A1I2GWG5_9BACL|nr:flavin reductase family protein [Paenibacillus catalpae]SFF21137.1 NADH-FMN oxidoreductase RutF, flavin reductase (DIM6/NTAB) family [Paenibacillus catalpae]